MLARLEAPPLSSVVSGPTPEVLAHVRDPATTLAIWNRLPRLRPRREAAALAGAGPFSIVAEDSPSRLAAALVQALPLPAPALLAEVTLLARHFAAIAGVVTVRARLEALIERGCPVFHADHVGLRLLVAYAGPGTEWVPDTGVNRAALGSGSNRAIVPDPRAIRRLPEFAAGILKGEAFPGNRGRGVVHRSAPASRARPRLLLCLDEPGRF